MGTRIGRTPKGRKRGCWLFGLTLLGAPLLTVALTAASCDTRPAPPPPADQSQQQYRSCVNIDRRQATQDRCQVHVWGQTFGEDDPRWDCAHMGNWSCGPLSKNEKQENH